MDNQGLKKQVFFRELCILLNSQNWSDELIKQIEKQSDMTEGYHRILFPNGKSQIATEFEEYIDKEMLVSLEKQEKPKKVREQIGIALENRIINTVPKNVILRNNSFFTLPNNIFKGAESACRTCDKIWEYAGDESTDFNYYTKRGLLLPVYLSAKSFYITDNSEFHRKTKEFIKNALDNIINIASLKKHINMPKIEDVPILRLFS